MKRRRFLAASGTVATVVLAGCGNPDDGDGGGDGDGDGSGGGGVYDVEEPGQLGPEESSD